MPWGYFKCHVFERLLTYRPTPLVYHDGPQVTNATIDREHKHARANCIHATRFATFHPGLRIVKFGGGKGCRILLGFDDAMAELNILLFKSVQ